MPTAVVLAVAAATAGAAHAVTPANGGDAGGTPTTVNDGPGDQTEPHVGGNLGVYTGRADIFAAGRIHYVDFPTGSDGVVPAGAPGDSDVLPDVNGGRIVFSRTRASDSATAAMLFDRATGVVTELDPAGSFTERFGTVIGGDTVAFAEFGGANGDLSPRSRKGLQGRGNWGRRFRSLNSGTGSNIVAACESFGAVASFPSISPGVQAVPPRASVST